MRKAKEISEAMPDHYHAVVWIDHHEAKIFHFSAAGFDAATIRSSQPHRHLHHKANTIGSGHAAVERGFLERVAEALDVSGAVLITGPAGAKHELAGHIAKFHPQLAARISAVETLDHPTDGEIVALARKFFRADDRMHPQQHP
jgi:hypothetical protein